MFPKMLFHKASHCQVSSHKCAVDEEGKKKASIYTHLPYYRWCSKGWGDVMPLWSFSLLHFDSPLFSMHFGGNILPFCTRFHPFCRKYCKRPKWKPLNSSSLRLTRIDVIASLGLPWKHGAPKNSNTLIQPALGLAWRGWLFVSIHNPSSDSKQ